MMKLKIDPDYKSIFPVLTPEQYTGLERDIIKHGILSPIIVWDGTIIDGHNRYAIAQAHRFSEDQIPTKSIVFNSRPDAVEWIINHQENRRNLTKSQMVDAWAVYESERAKEAKGKHDANGGDKKSEAYRESATSNLNQPISNKKRNPTTAAEVAKKIGVSENTYRDMKLIRERGTPEQIARMNKGGKGNGVSRIAGEIKGARTKEQNSKKVLCCRKCGKSFPIIEAHKNGDGRPESLCRSCRNNYNRKSDEKKRLEGTDGFYVDSVEVKEWTVQGVVDQLKRDFSDYLEGLRIELDVHMAEIRHNGIAIDAAIDGFVEQLTQMKGVYR